jgi:hypothetical protein
MATQKNKILPFRDYDEHEVLGFFATAETGVAGTFVSISAFNPDAGDGWSSIAPGAEYPNVLSLRYQSNAKVIPAASGAKASQVLGITLKDTREFDENGEKLLFHPEKCDKLQCVVSGQPVPILKRGLVTLASSAYLGTVAPGYVGVIDNSGNGVLRAVDPAAIVTTGVGFRADQVVGRFISSAGTKNGGYALFEVSV